MPASKAQQKAVTKYMKAKYDEIKVRVEKGQKDRIQTHAEARSESVNGFIGRAISETMERDGSGNTVTNPDGIHSSRVAVPGAVQQEAGTAPAGRVVYQVPAADTAGSSQEAAETAAGAGVVSLPPDALEAAERAAKRTGETVAAFVARAVVDQEKRDDKAFKLGINPA